MKLREWCQTVSIYARLNGRDLVHTVVALGALASIGVGLWWVHPGSSLVVVGALLLCGVIFARTR